MWIPFSRFTTVLATALVLTLGHAQGQAPHSAARLWNEQNLAAIRINLPNPPAHARNLFHTATAMYDAWAAYDPTAVGYIYNEKISPLPADVEAARAEAVSYAAYRVLYARYSTGQGSGTTITNLNNQLTSLGFSVSVAQGSLSNATTPSELGKRVGQAILTYSASDGFSQTAFPHAYDTSVNSNVAPANVLSVLGTNGLFQTSMPLGAGIPDGTNPNMWQPLALSSAVSQNGLPDPNPGGIQAYVGVQELATKAFSLTRSDNTKPWLDPYGPPAQLSINGNTSPTDATYKANAMDVLVKSSQLNDPTVIDISPGSVGNNPLGTDDGTGYTTNPITNQPYAPNPVSRADFVRVLAEFWADGPNSETPPGHWHVLANQVADDPNLVKQIGGTGPVVNDLEWDVKTYFSIAGAVHDAACAAWSLKRYYSGTRPITAIRYMGKLGQSSDPSDVNTYNPAGLPLQAGVVEVITSATAAPGGRHEQIWNMFTSTSDAGSNHIGQIAVYSWPAEDQNNLPAPSIATHQSTVRWMLAKDWVPFQRKTFNTPAFPGYVSGHSTFSRAAAEVLTHITGSSSFPGGFHHYTKTANTLQIDLGPSADVDLQWNTYYDAADQAGISRRWGGIHPVEDDLKARVIGAQVGVSAYTLAQKYWSGAIESTTTIPVVTIQQDGSALITWPATVGQYQKVQTSTDQITWTDVSSNTYEYTTSGSVTIASPVPGASYQVITTAPSAARTWNEQNLAAIRINVPNPPAHARNLFHNAVAMYDAWAAYDNTAVGYIYNEKISPLPSGTAAIEAARFEAISYASYRVLRSRYASPQVGFAANLAAFDAQLTALGFSPSIGQAALTNDTTPAELGKRVGQAILNWGAGDQFSNVNYPQAYTTAVNPNVDPNLAMTVLGNNGEFPDTRLNMQLGVGIPDGSNPNFWQPLALSSVVSQNGIALPKGTQTFVGVQSLATVPFSLTRSDATKPWFDPGPPSKLALPGSPSATDAAYKAQALAVIELSGKLDDTTLVNISPGVFGNNSLGADDGTGHPTNPVTHAPYPDNFVQLGDFGRSLAEFWADGPNSETPPGHWHVLANEVADDPLTVKRIRGTGPVLNNLEWDVKAYLSVAASVHDAACAAWAVKRYYNGPRPITMIRYMATQGQSSDSSLPSYSDQGLPLKPGVVELVTPDTAADGGRHALIWNMYYNAYESGNSHLNELVVYAWPGENYQNAPAPSIATFKNPVRWMLAKDWITYQRKTFNTPAFPGYISGHSAFSRAAAEALTLLTGTSAFPGGFYHHVRQPNTLANDLGPSTAVDLQWATYYDAADQAGLSRRWGGIHISEDDYVARIVGSQVGKTAYALAEKYWTGTIQNETINPSFGFLNGGGIVVKWNTTRGMYYKVQTSSDLSNWTDATGSVLYYDTVATFTDASPPPGARFYRVLKKSGP